MWITDPLRRIPRLGFFVSSSEEPLHHPEIPSSSSVWPESLFELLLVDLLVTHCWDNSTTVACVRLLQPYHGLVKYGAIALTRPIWYSGGNMPFIMAWLSFGLHGQWLTKDAVYDLSGISGLSFLLIWRLVSRILGTRRRCGMMDIISYVQGLAQPLVIIHYLYVSTASLS